VPPVGGCRTAADVKRQNGFHVFREDDPIGSYPHAVTRSSGQSQNVAIAGYRVIGEGVEDRFPIPFWNQIKFLCCGIGENERFYRDNNRSFNT
jgi:hypothetical protein